MAQAKKFELFMGCLGNGITVANKAVMSHGDYKNIAHISDRGEISWYVKQDYPPPEAKAKIEAAAADNRAKYAAWVDRIDKMKLYGMILDEMPLAELCAVRDRSVDEVIASWRQKWDHD